MSQALPGQRLRLLVRDPSAQAAALARIAGSCDDPVLVVVADEGQAELLSRSLTPLLGLGKRPAPVHCPWMGDRGRRYWLPENEAARCAALAAALAGHPGPFLVSAASLFAPAFPAREFRDRVFTLQVGTTDWSPEMLAERLVHLDYDNEFEVGQVGEFARRGGILDLFPPTEEAPVRIEFFGNEIDTMRRFDPQTQRSSDPVETVRVVPRGDAGVVPEHPTGATFRDYLPDRILVTLCFPREIIDHLQTFGSQPLADQVTALADRAPHLVAIEEDLASNTEPFAAVDHETRFDGFGLEEVIPILTADLGEGGMVLHRQNLAGQLRQWTGRKHVVVACCGSEGEARRFCEVRNESPELRDIPMQVEPLALDAGLFIPSAGLVLLSERELFARVPELAAPVRRRRRRPDSLFQDSSGELEDGRHAVHAVHGICLYHGVTEMEVAGVLQEAVELEFADDARLYVPLDQIHLVTRYTGGTRKLPNLSRIGAASWRRAKEAAAGAAWDFAAEMLRMEAMRSSAQGVAFPETDDWEQAFRASFPFVETPDQKRAIEEVLTDMSAAKPMDRLLCGDVGYGKTEVAMRAAFRAVMHCKQVAVLVPTTVLAQQHYATFRERMADYPILIESLTRFLSRGEQRAALERLAEGTVDIMIGTHRLLQSDVSFHDLGLVIVDEEQRFGVVHKERLKRLRASVDVLTMTATPIPRTLYFSVAGIRDLSTIMTPPEERLPVTTIVAQYEEPLVREAILREVERQGQVFFLHNRVKTIHRVADHLRELVPQARFEVAHGQMHPHELEDAMIRFVAHETDVLVCTTIIESGLDIRNANTILVDRADRFGLADLYQLRGRVGRYTRQAFAYFLLQPLGILGQDARERLAAIRRYTTMGAGFRLALRDLEIRGAGNLLGTEQSGHIAAIGFELYCELLREAVAQLSHRPVQRIVDVPVHLDFVSFGVDAGDGVLAVALPTEYVAEEQVRMGLYRELRKLRTEEALDAFAHALRDRFGPLPPPARHLLDVARIRLRAHAAGIVAVSVRDAATVHLQTERGLRKEPGSRTFPRLTTHTPSEKLAELLEMLR